MTILGVDYGRAKLGFAIGMGTLAHPLGVEKVSSFEDALNKVVNKARSEEADLILVGISEGAMAGEQKKFAKGLGNLVDIPVRVHDETLSTQEAQKLAISAGLRRSRRKELEDAFAASVVLQSYLDSH